MRPRSLAVAAWLFSRAVPKEHRETLLGDLEEEYALRADAASSSDARKWYLRQIVASTPPLLWSRLTRAAWPATLSVALVAYLAVGVAQVIIQLALAGSSAPGYQPIALVLIFPVVVVIGYFAERLRRGAAIVLGAMMLLVITAMTLLTTEDAPAWYRAAYFVVGPAAALIGSVLSSRRRTEPMRS